MSEMKMAKVNYVTMSGRLTKDVTLRYIPSGDAVANLSIAVNRNYKKGDEWQEEVSYFDIVVWKKRAEQCAEKLSKGSAILVEGYLRTRSYVDSNNQNRKSTEIVAGKVQFLEKTEYKEQQNYQQPTKEDEEPF